YSPILFSSLLHCSGSHRPLPSFPTRRSSDLALVLQHRPYRSQESGVLHPDARSHRKGGVESVAPWEEPFVHAPRGLLPFRLRREDRKSTRLNSSHVSISYAVFCLKKKKKHTV